MVGKITVCAFDKTGKINIKCNGVGLLISPLKINNEDLLITND